jgi:broad specificity phosphatase PhoE
MTVHRQALLVVLVCCITPQARAQKAVYLVRHAEKAGDAKDSPLTLAGTDRAQALARHLKDAGISVIYTSDARRTKDTAAPLAAALGVTPVEVTDGDAATIFTKARTDHPDAVILVVGHSNTVPTLIAKWGASSPVTIGANEFDRLFVVVPTGPATAGLARFRYQTSGP